MERQGAGPFEAAVLLLGMGRAPDRLLLPVVTDRENDDRGGRTLSAAFGCLDGMPGRSESKKEAISATLCA